MWSNPKIDNLLNPEYEKVTDYRKLFRLIGYQICVDVGTRNDTGEAHILLLSHQGRWGILVVHDQYEAGLPPQFCMPHIKSVTRFHSRLDREIVWFDAADDAVEWTTSSDNQDKNFVLIRRSVPLIAGFFFRDMLEFFKEKGFFS